MGRRMHLVRETLDRFTHACESNELVLAAFLGGSVAAGTADEQSDLDVYVITRTADYERFFEQRQAFLKSFGDVAWWTDHRNFEGLGFDMVPFVMSDGTDGELALAHEDNFQTTHGGPHEVLVDRTGFLEGVTFPRGEFEPPSPDAGTIDMTIGLYWTVMRAALKCWTRGKWWMAASHIAGLRAQCLTLARSIGVEDAETRLLATFGSATKADLGRAIGTLLDLFLEWGPPAAQAASIEFPTRLWDAASKRIRTALAAD